MSIQVVLLRGINVGGRSIVSMSSLREMLVELEFRDVKTILQSGNVVLDSPKLAGADLEAFLEREAKAVLGREIMFVVRSAGEWTKIVKSNPMRDAAETDPSHLVIHCLKKSIRKEDVDRLMAAYIGPERIAGDLANLYIHYSEGIGTSKLTSAFLDAKLGSKGTARNWNTVLKIAELAG